MRRAGLDLRNNLKFTSFGHLNVLRVEVMQLLDEAFRILGADDVKQLFGADNAWDVVEEVLVRYFNERLWSPRRGSAWPWPAARCCAGWPSRTSCRPAAAQFEALLLEIAEYAEEWLTQRRRWAWRRRTGTDRVMPWEQMGQAGVAARYAERSPAQMPPAARAGGPIYPRRNGLGTYRGGQGGVPARRRR